MVQSGAVRVSKRLQRAAALLLGLALLALFGPALAFAQAGTDRAAIDDVVVRAARTCEQKRCEDALDELERADAVSPPRADLQFLLGESAERVLQHVRLALHQRQRERANPGLACRQAAKSRGSWRNRATSPAIFVTQPA